MFHQKMHYDSYFICLLRFDYLVLFVSADDWIYTNILLLFLEYEKKNKHIYVRLYEACAHIPCGFCVCRVLNPKKRITKSLHRRRPQLCVVAELLIYIYFWDVYIYVCFYCISIVLLLLLVFKRWNSDFLRVFDVFVKLIAPDTQTIYSMEMDNS